MCYTPFMLSESQKYQLQFLKDIFEISDLCSTKTYIWGGLATDILEGNYLREHHDIDGFTVNLLDVKTKMEILFQQRGYTTSFKNDFDMLRVEKDGCHAAFNRLEIENNTAMWRHIGNEGTVYFPEAWLKNEPKYFFDIPVLISGIEFEYSIKARVKLLSPVWELRETDLKALEYWSKKIEEQSINPEHLLRQIWSDNPYWRKKGYKE
jgi:hypothetical protein